MSIRISERSVTRSIKDISWDFFVRQELNADWAIQLSLFIDAGVEMDPIYITRENKGIDGRHRYEGHDLAGKTEIKCKIVEADDDVEFVVFALKCNMGGSLPPNKGDIEHTIQELLNRGVPKKQIADLLMMLPGKIVRKYLSDVESQMQRAKLAKAATAVVEGGLNLPKAAEQYQVSESDLRTLLNTRTKGKTKRGIDEIERQFSMVYRTTGNRNAASIRRLLEMYQDGDVSHRQVIQVFNHLDHLIKRSTRSIGGWRKRFDAMEAPKKIA